MTKPSELGRLIRTTRTSVGMTLRELARRIRKSPAFVVMLEKDPSPPSVSEDTLRAVARELNLDIDELIGLSGRIPEELQHSSAQEIALFRRVKELSPEEQEKLLRQLDRGKK